MPDTVTPVPSWLSQFPPHQQRIIRAWAAAVKVPGMRPDDLLHRLAETVSHRLDWTPSRDTEALCRGYVRDR